MIPEQLHLIVFSPTGTTKKIVNAIGDGIEKQSQNHIDLTLNQSPLELTFSENDIVVIGIPVYAGRVPKIALDRIKHLKGKNTKAVLIAVYGNRDYDDALLEMKHVTVANGFLPIAAGAFIGVHSFSSEQYPIAENRPDSADLRLATDFGRQIMGSLEKSTPVNVPGNFPYRERPPKHQVILETDEGVCTLCRLCEKNCPVGAVSIKEHTVKTDESLCIFCHACVKLCTQQARTLKNNRLLEITRFLAENCKQPRKPELFL